MSVVPRGCDGAKVIQVIKTEALRGSGVHPDVARRVIQYWSLDGQLLAENDPFQTGAGGKE